MINIKLLTYYFTVILRNNMKQEEEETLREFIWPGLLKNVEVSTHCSRTEMK